MATLTALYIYPVKSLAGVAVGEAAVTERGLRHDRRFMVVGPGGEFFTQREHPRMATVWTEISGAELRLSAPEAGEVVLAAEPGDGEPLEVHVWNSDCRAIAPSMAADRWLSEYLGTACRLVYMPDGSRRIANPKFAGAGQVVSFADGYAHLLVGEGSLADLNARLATKGHCALPMNRFRPNLVVAGAAAFAEDGWSEVRIGTALLRAAKPCGRCQVTTTDQATGEVRGPEPLATLTGYRDSPEFGARFGVNFVTARTGTLRVGDAVEILA